MIRDMKDSMMSKTRTTLVAGISNLTNEVVVAAIRWANEGRLDTKNAAESLWRRYVSQKNDQECNCE